ncbi:MAG TPA: hypothetical protein VKT21_02470 [Thermoplasmata archaeon]|nr:hypothetical protein [Thermoplasmata archaeon]
MRRVPPLGGIDLRSESMDNLVAAILLLDLAGLLLLLFLRSRRRKEWTRLRQAALQRLRSPLNLLTFRESRRVVRAKGNRGPAILIGLVYALASMLIGYMLEIFPSSSLGFFWILLPSGRPSWDYPALLIAGPNEVISLPFLPTLTMVLVAIGVALGGGVALASVRDLIRNRRAATPAQTAISSSAGIAPAVTGLATLGACCCVACATAGGVAVVAAASGTSYANLLANNWYLDAFQIAVVWFSLLVQERNLRRAVAGCLTPVPRSARTYASGALRVGLLVAGITWSLAMFVEWGSTNPLTATAPIWYHWIFEHQLLSVVAVTAALFPKEFAALVRASFGRVTGLPWRVGLLAAGLTWGTWVPPALTRVGLGGFLNELLGYLGAPAALGAIAPDAPLGAALLFHWVAQHLLLASFALALAAAPQHTTAALLWSVGQEKAPSPKEREAAVNNPTVYPSS